ncbi:peptidylprolyl isomerase [Azospirillum sp. ST 5-10]|uniref:peptidylprolyl isomerase n=1 Tax=unclassified Azospirillum TaxID=2630922 RepID=UPI003F4A309B
MNRVLRAALLSLAASGVALGAHAQGTPPAPAATAAQESPSGTAAQQPADPVIARVDGQEIHASDLMRMAGQLPPQVRQMPLEMLYPAILEQLVNQKLIAGAGYKAGLQGSEQVKQELKAAEERAVQRAYVEQKIQERITPEALDEAYKQYLKDNPSQEEVKASHILVENEAEAKEIIDQLQKGGDFAKIAKEKSKDTAAAAQGGDLGYFTKDAMVEPFAEAAFAMKPGDISKAPVQTQFGWHVIKVEDRRTPEPPTLDQVKPDLERELSKEIVAGLVDELRTTAKIETYQLDGSPMPAAGEPAKEGGDAEAKPDAAKKP